MTRDFWLPIGYKLPDGTTTRSALFEGPNWQILETLGNGRALVVRDKLAHRWLDSGLLEIGVLTPFDFGDVRLGSIACAPSQVLCPVSEGTSPRTKSEALAFAISLKGTRAIDKEA